MRSRTKRLGLIVGIVIPLVILFIVFYVFNVSGILKENVSEYLDEIANMAVLAVDRQVESDSLLVESIAVDIELLKEQNIKITGEILKAQSDLGHFKRVGYADTSGNAVTSDNAIFRITDREYFRRGLQGETSVSDTIEDKVDGRKINVYSVPIYKNDVVDGVLFATYENRNYCQMLSVGSFGGRGYSYVVKSDGTTVASPADEGRLIFSNAFDLFEESSFKIDRGYSIKEMKENMQQYKEGMLGYEFLGEKRYMNYVPMNVNDWYVLSIVPAQVAAKKINQAMLLTICICISLFAGMMFLFIYLFRSQKKQKSDLYEAAFRDLVTEKTNYAKFKIDIATLLKAEEKLSFAIIKFDIIKFKTINALFGYQEGNRTLKIVSDKLEEFTRRNEIFARITADCFILLASYTDKNQLESRLLALDAQLLRIPKEQGKNYRMILKYGVYFVQNREMEISAMLDCADMALKKARDSNVNFIEYYAQTMRQQVLREVTIENEMEAALAQGEFQIYLQPKFCTQTQRVIGAEALIRWIHPVNGVVPPNEFIPIFERNGFIIKLDMYVLESVCRLLKKWKDNHQRMVPIAVNISRVHLYDTSFVSSIDRLIQQYEVDPSYIEFELTESTIFENVDILLSVMEKLNVRGFSLAMDDFGSGYSSLNLLKRIPLDVVKLDKGFFDGDSILDRSKIVIGNLVRMIHDLKMTIVAEGVETDEQFEFLREIHCDIIQGFLLGKPMPTPMFDSLVQGESEAEE